MICEQCGRHITEGSLFCENCGKKVNNEATRPIEHQAQSQPPISMKNKTTYERKPGGSIKGRVHITCLSVLVAVLGLVLVIYGLSIETNNSVLALDAAHVDMINGTSGGMFALQRLVDAKMFIVLSGVALLIGGIVGLLFALKKKKTLPVYISLAASLLVAAAFYIVPIISYTEPIVGNWILAGYETGNAVEHSEYISVDDSPTDGVASSGTYSCITVNADGTGDIKTIVMNSEQGTHFTWELTYNEHVYPYEFTYSSGNGAMVGFDFGVFDKVYIESFTDLVFVYERANESDYADYLAEMDNMESELPEPVPAITPEPTPASTPEPTPEPTLEPTSTPSPTPEPILSPIEILPGNSDYDLNADGNVDKIEFDGSPEGSAFVIAINGDAFETDIPTYYKDVMYDDQVFVLDIDASDDFIDILFVGHNPMYANTTILHYDGENLYYTPEYISYYPVSSDGMGNITMDFEYGEHQHVYDVFPETFEYSVSAHKEVVDYLEPIKIIGGEQEYDLDGDGDGDVIDRYGFSSDMLTFTINGLDIIVEDITGSIDGMEVYLCDINTSDEFLNILYVNVGTNPYEVVAFEYNGIKLFGSEDVDYAFPLRSDGMGNLIVQDPVSIEERAIAISKFNRVYD